MPTYRMIFRKPEPPGTLELMDDFVEAKNMEEAKRIFEERHGVGRVVAGPIKVDPSKVK